VGHGKSYGKIPSTPDYSRSRGVEKLLHRATLARLRLALVLGSVVVARVVEQGAEGAGPRESAGGGGREAGAPAASAPASTRCRLLSAGGQHEAAQDPAERRELLRRRLGGLPCPGRHRSRWPRTHRPAAPATCRRATSAAQQLLPPRATSPEGEAEELLRRLGCMLCSAPSKQGSSASGREGGRGLLIRLSSIRSAADGAPPWLPPPDGGGGRGSAMG
jgi:hypothetical protein